MRREWEKKREGGGEKQLQRKRGMNRERDKQRERKREREGGRAMKRGQMKRRGMQTEIKSGSDSSGGLLKSAEDTQVELQIGGV